MSIEVSVVVPTYRRPELLDRCVAALLAQDLEPGRFEVIVVDDGACKETESVVARRVGQAERVGLHLRYLCTSGGRGPGAARNLGWRAARGWLVAFTDDDCLPEGGWLRAGLAACGDADGASGRLVVPIPSRPTDYERSVSQLENALFVTANCFYRRRALEAVGGFDVRFTVAWREDSDLHFSLLERGARLVQASEAVVNHPVRRAGWGSSIAGQRKSMFNALLYKKHRRLYRDMVQPGPPWAYYGAVLALGAASTGAVCAARRCLLGGLAPWLWLTLRFCLRRLRGTSHAPSHVAEMALTSVVIPPLAIYWRLRGAVRFRVFFL